MSIIIVITITMAALSGSLQMVIQRSISQTQAYKSSMYIPVKEIYNVPSLPFQWAHLKNNTIICSHFI